MAETDLEFEMPVLKKKKFKCFVHGTKFAAFLPYWHRNTVQMQILFTV
jgi:hypothetical protein